MSKSAGGSLVQRDAAIERIAKVGRRQWRKESGAHRQARAENVMFRYKRLIGDRLRAKITTTGTYSGTTTLTVNAIPKAG